MSDFTEQKRIAAEILIASIKSNQGSSPSINVYENKERVKEQAEKIAAAYSVIHEAVKSS